MKKIRVCIAALVILSLFLTSSVFAGEQGHYTPMAIGVRDYVQPPKGVYLVNYNMYYGADTYKDSNADKLESLSVAGMRTTDLTVLGRSVPVTITGNLNVDLDVKLDMFAQVLILVWVPDVKILGADYAFFIAPSWGSVSVTVDAKANANGTITVGGVSKSLSANRSAEINDTNTGFGDLYVQPIWLAWRDKHYDVSVSYGIYAPIGFYDKDNIANIGLGFLTQQVQANAYYYPFENQATALRVTPTYEWHSEKIDQQIQPGQTLTLEYGLSQYIHPRAELGVLAYNQWQISKDRGRDATNTGVYDMVGGIGGQITCWAVENKCAIVAKVSKEYWAKDRFEGIGWSINVTWIF